MLCGQQPYFRLMESQNAPATLSTERPFRAWSTSNSDGLADAEPTLLYAVSEPHGYGGNGCESGWVSCRGGFTDQKDWMSMKKNGLTIDVTALGVFCRTDCLGSGRETMRLGRCTRLK